MRSLIAAAAAAAALAGCTVPTSPESRTPPIGQPISPVGYSSAAQTPTEQVKSYFLGEGRAELMTKCDFGRQYNSVGVSYWDYAKKKEREASATANGFSPALVEGFAAGEAAAMAQVCPDVR